MIMLEPLGKGLLGTTLRYDYEVHSEKDYFTHVPSPRVSKDMISLAAHILEAGQPNSIWANSKTITKRHYESSCSARRRATLSRHQSLKKSPAM